MATIDEAFQSRIQLALHYPPLNENSRCQVWKNFFEMMEERGEKANFAELKRGVKQLAKHDINGRQIRNVTATAREVALYKGEELRLAHLELAIGPMEDFANYLKFVHGHDPAEWALEQKFR